MGQTRVVGWATPPRISVPYATKFDVYLEGTACLSEDGAMAQDRHQKLIHPNNIQRFEQAPARRIGKWGSPSGYGSPTMILRGISEWVRPAV